MPITPPRCSGCSLSAEEGAIVFGRSGAFASEIMKNRATSDFKQAPRSETAEKILDLAEMLIQTRGYSAFSYKDISDVLGIRKAGIHYHFEFKTDLGVAVVDRYAERFGKALANIAGQQVVVINGHAYCAICGVRRYARQGVLVWRAGRRNSCTTAEIT